MIEKYSFHIDDIENIIEAKLKLISFKKRKELIDIDKLYYACCY